MSGILDKLKTLRQEFVELAKQNVEKIMHDYTHLQHAQPVYFRHHWMVYYSVFTRDSKRFIFIRKHIDLSPLVASALVGTTFPAN